MGLGTFVKFGGRKSKKKFVDPLGLKKSKPDTSKTAQELALERTQRSLLDEEIGESEKRFKALSRGTLGRSSLLSGAARTTATAAGRPRASGASGTGSLLGGGSTSSPSAVAKGVSRSSGRVK